jgi:hypothetical protein
MARGVLSVRKRLIDAAKTCVLWLDRQHLGYQSERKIRADRIRGPVRACSGKTRRQTLPGGRSRLPKPGLSVAPLRSLRYLSHPANGQPFDRQAGREVRLLLLPQTVVPQREVPARRPAQPFHFACWSSLRSRERFWPLFERVLAEVWKAKHEQHVSSKAQVAQKLAKTQKLKEQLIHVLVNNKLKHSYFDD